METERFDEIIAAELTLLDPRIRRDRAALERWLDPAFTEIGQLGRFWTREAVFADLLATDQSDYEQAILREPRVTELAEGWYLLTYALQVGSRHSRRSSIWRMDGDQPRMLFHQGTPISLPS